MSKSESKKFSYQKLRERKELLPELARWYYTEWGHEVPNRTQEIEQSILEQSLGENSLPITIIATEQGALHGAGQLKWKEMSIYPNKEYWLGGIIIRKESRGRGLAKQIIKKLLEIAKANKIDRLYLQTEKLDGGLYAHLGWKELEMVHYHNTKVLVMEWDWSVEDGMA